MRRRPAAAGAAPALRAVSEDHRGALSIDVLQDLRRVAGGCRRGRSAARHDVNLLDATVLAAAEYDDAVAGKAHGTLAERAGLDGPLRTGRQIANRDARRRFGQARQPGRELGALRGLGGFDRRLELTHLAGGVEFQVGEAGAVWREGCAVAAQLREGLDWRVRLRQPRPPRCAAAHFVGEIAAIRRKPRRAAVGRDLGRLEQFARLQRDRIGHVVWRAGAENREIAAQRRRIVAAIPRQIGVLQPHVGGASRYAQPPGHEQQRESCESLHPDILPVQAKGRHPTRGYRPLYRGLVPRLAVARGPARPAIARD